MIKFLKKLLNSLTISAQFSQKKMPQNLQQQQKSQKNNMENWLRLIKRYEGFRSTPYLDAVKVPTVGYGCTVYPDGTRVKLSDAPITEEKATALLLSYVINNILPHIKDLSLTENQQTAVISLMYNIGTSAFLKSKCYKAIKAKDWETVFKNWDWCKGGGKFLVGLAKRRAEELHLFFQDL